MKKLISIIVVMVCFVSLLMGCSKSEKALITIGDQKAVKEEALFFLNDMQSQYEQQYGPEVMYNEYSEGKTVGDAFKEEALNTVKMINIAAVVAKERGIALTEEEITKQKTDAKGYFEGLDPVVVEEQGFTLELIENVFIKYLTFDKLKKDMASKVTIDEVKFQADLLNIAVQDAKYTAIQKYGVEGAGTKVRVRHILLTTVDETRAPLAQEAQDAALKVAEEVLAKVKNGEDFVSLVAEYSQDPGSVETGGEYTFSRMDGFAPEFTEAAYTIEAGKTSDLVKTDFGYHIILVEEKDILPTAEELQEIQSYKEYAETYVKSMQTDAAFEVEYETWKTQYTVEVNQELWDSVIVKGQTGTVAPSPAASPEVTVAP